MKLIVNKPTTEQVEIPVPCFFRDKYCSNWVALLDENTIVTITTIGTFTAIRNMDATLSTAQTELARAYQDFHGCSEAEFLEKFDQTVESISLHPKLAV